MMPQWTAVEMGSDRNVGDTTDGGKERRSASELLKLIG